MEKEKSLKFILWKENFPVSTAVSTLLVYSFLRLLLAQTKWLKTIRMYYFMV